MKKFGLAAAAVALYAGSAFAADLPARKDAPVFVPPPPPPLWTGFYGGLNAGYGWGASNGVATDTTAVTDAWAAGGNSVANVTYISRAIPGATALASSGVASVNQNGFIGGGQIGYNFQFGPSFVAGVEVDMQGTGIRGSGGASGAWRGGYSYTDANTNPINATRTVVGASQYTAGVDWLGTVRGRLGWLVMPTLLVYGTGGFAYGGVHASATHALGATEAGANVANAQPFSYSIAVPTFGGVGNYSGTRTGWTAGGGFEWMIAPNWSVKAEALYYDLGSVTFASTPVGAFSNGAGAGPSLAYSNAPATRVRYDGVIARAGVNYHLNWGAVPVVAKF